MTKENNTNAIAPLSSGEGRGGEVITSDTVTMSAEGQSTDTSSWGNKVRMGTLALMTALAPSATTTTITLGGTGLVATMASCGDKDKDPNPEEIPLTAEEKLFASAFDPTNQKLIDKGWVKPSILDGKPVVVVPVSPVPNNTNFTEAFKGFMDIEIRLINAKTGQYSITPIINKSSLEKIFTKASEINPGKPFYYLTLVNEAINGDIKRNLMSGVSVADRDDNNPATPTPYLLQLPIRFTLDEFAKYNSFSIDKSKSFDLTRSESFKMIMDVDLWGRG
ncbi:MAG: hypothetical protein IPO04_10710 [Cytophagaceae bacterium]|nr:hypothetical protein [Cytophagaceae bacterium]